MGALSAEFSHNYNLNTFVHRRSLPRVSYARTHIPHLKTKKYMYL
jgi:hypothetical protein